MHNIVAATARHFFGHVCSRSRKSAPVFDPLCLQPKGKERGRKGKKGGEGRVPHFPFAGPSSWLWLETQLAPRQFGGVEKGKDVPLPKRWSRSALFMLII